MHRHREQALTALTEKAALLQSALDDALAAHQQAQVQMAESVEARAAEAEGSPAAAQTELAERSAALADAEQQVVQSQAALKKLRDERLSDAEAAGDQAAQLAELRAAADTAEDRSNELLAALSQA
jgi:hypothetical protein